MYYTGISGLQTFRPNYEDIAPEEVPYTNLSSTNYNLPQPQPVQQNISPMVEQSSSISPGQNPLMNIQTSARPNASSSIDYAKSISDVPDVVQQASQRYMAGNAGYGDQSSSLFNKNLLGQYNQWEGQYEKYGDQFVPWALSKTGGNYNPAEVDLYGQVAGKNPAFSFNPNQGNLYSADQFFNPISGVAGNQANSKVYGALSRNYGDISNDYLQNQFNQWRSLGATGLPDDIGAYASRYYQSLIPKPGYDMYLALKSGATPEQRAQIDNFEGYLRSGYDKGYLNPANEKQYWAQSAPPQIRTTMIG